MNRRSPFSIRGRHALVMVSDDRELSTLRRQLDRLGVGIHLSPATDAAPPGINVVDIIILDADLFPIEPGSTPSWMASLPMVALIGTETPSRLKWLLDLNPASYLVKPLRSAGLFSAMVIAFDNFQRRADVNERIERLGMRLRSRRIVSAAVLQIMHDRDIGEPDAFALLRRAAMKQRMTIEQLSADLLATEESALRAVKMTQTLGSAM